MLRKMLLAAFCGILATLTLPPIYLYPLLVPAYTGLFWLVNRVESRWRAFGVGWAFGLGYFSTGLYWFAHALLVEPEKFAWMIPFAVLGLPSVLGIFYGLGTALLYHLRRWLPPLGLVFAFGGIWWGTEFLRGVVLTGFPWNMAVYSWAFSDAMPQAVYLIGSEAFSAWTVILAALPALWWLDRSRANVALLIMLVMLVLPFGYGLWRLEAFPASVAEDALPVHLVQGNIPQALKWQPEERVKALNIYREMTQKANLPENSVVVWPETAFPFVLEEGTPPVIWAVSALPEGGRLITGALRAEHNAEEVEEYRFYNSLQVLSPVGKVLAVYDKVKLVPFGEFVPLRSILPVERITHGMGDFTRGAGARVLEVAGMPIFQPLICYEVIYPHYVPDSQPLAEWLVVVTNDAWFGDSTGPHQHLQMTRYRAIERGVPLVRAANTGMSAAYDALGREIGRIPLNQRGSLRLLLPPSIRAMVQSKR